MPHPFKISVRTAPEDSPREYSGAFSDPDARDFALFTEAEAELGACEYVKANMPLDVTISWKAGTGFAPPTLPPPAQVSEFLHRLRPFVLESEPTGYLRILSLVGKYYVDAPLRDNMKVGKFVFLGENSQRYYRLKVADLVVNSDAALRVWLNAFEYHRDVDKRAYLGDLSKAVPLDVMKLIFLDTLRDKATAIFWMAMFLRCALNSATSGHSVTIAQTADGG